MLTELFTNLREFSVSSKGIDFAEEVIPFADLSQLRHLEQSMLLLSYQELLQFDDTADFIAVRAKGKNCTKGWPCGNTCLSSKRAKNCDKPLLGQAKTYAQFLENQKKGSSGGGSSQTKANPELDAAQSALKSAQARADVAGQFYGKQLTTAAANEIGIKGLKAGDTLTWAAYKSVLDARDKAQSELDKLSPKQKSDTPKADPSKPMSAEEAGRSLSPDERKELRTALTPPPSSRSSAGKEQLEISSDRAKQIKERAKRAGFNAVNNLDDLELRSLISYTANGYVGINGAMRGQQANPDSKLAKQQRLAARQVNQALQKLPAFEGTVRRDTRLQKADVDRDYKVGNVITFKGLTSTSSDLKAKGSSSYGKTESLSKASFYGDRAKAAGMKPSSPGSDNVQVSYTIKSKSGRDISGLSDRPWEKEVLLPHNFKGKVTKVEIRDGKYFVSMEEV